jgi:hypothetical protein
MQRQLKVQVLAAAGVEALNKRSFVASYRLKIEGKGSEVKSDRIEVKARGYKSRNGTPFFYQKARLHVIVQTPSGYDRPEYFCIAETIAKGH